MNNSQIFKSAHATAKSTRSLFTSYRGAFSSALRTIYAELREEKSKNGCRVIKKVYVHWSESDVFNNILGTNCNFDIEKTISIEQYERLASIEAVESDESQAYSKTKVDVILANGQVITFRHDINLKNRSLRSDWNQWVDHCEKQAA